MSEAGVQVVVEGNHLSPTQIVLFLSGEVHDSRPRGETKHREWERVEDWSEEWCVSEFWERR